MRFRHVFIGLGSLLVITALLLSDPDSGVIKSLPFGSDTVALIINLTVSVLYIGLLHVARKGLVDYIDLKMYFVKALQSSEGSGLAIIGVGLIMLSVSLTILAATI